VQTDERAHEIAENTAGTSPSSASSRTGPHRLARPTHARMLHRATLDALHWAQPPMPVRWQRQQRARLADQRAPGVQLDRERV